MKKSSKSKIQKSILFCMIVLFEITIIAQPNIEWQKCLGGSIRESGNSIQQTTDSGYIVTGKTNSDDGDVSGNHGNVDMWVVKLDLEGALEWQKCLGGSDWDEGFSIQQTTDGGYIVFGCTKSDDGDVSGNHGDFDMWVVKLDSLGAIEWQKCLGGSNYDAGLSIQQTIDGGFIMTGKTSSNDGDVSGNHGNYDMWVVKLDSVGTIEWQKCLGGSDTDAGWPIQQTTDGGYIVSGNTNSDDGDVSGNHGNYDMWVVKLDSIGTIEWQKCLGGSDLDAGFSIQQTIDGGFIMSGKTNSDDGDVSGNHGNYDMWVVKLDSVGTLEWQKCLGGSNLEISSSIQQTIDGRYITAGFTDSNDGDVSGNHGNYDMWVVLLDSVGALEWQKCIGGSDSEFSRSIQQTTDVGFIVTGDTESNDGDVSGNHGDLDLWVVKLWAILEANFIASDTIGTAPLTVNFTDQSTGNVTSWQWDFGNGNTSADQNPSNEYLNPGVYSVSLTITGPDGSDTIVKTNYITVNYPEPNANFEGTPTSGIAPLEVVFTDLSTDSVDSWDWDFGDGGISYQQFPNHIYSDAGYYNVSLTVGGPGGSDVIVKIDYISVFVDAPLADFSGSPTTGEAPLLVNFIDMSTGSIDTWNWDFGDNGSSSDQNPSHEYLTPGNYTVSLTVSGSGGTTNEVKTDYILIPVGLGENESKSTVIFPNPITNNLYVTFLDAKPRILTFSNMAGKMILEYNTIEKDVIINLQQFRRGVYSLVISDGSTNNVIKVIKK